ncbi:Lhr family ATP dependent helicase [Anseongella ginsenosidimutans]|uniref:Lhr family ATP dependent helicase n=1 Tax=Anseongella ginsenosidimutans TaxID=496056 RepID=A0A4R3KQR4_9SPHI|nr:DEAD/DEAH box helicase [Anseongella ginsenosidimutans]QEC52872.1 DEAD/DEAH box helicase [Anseongella ginsenosidimutans]TCS87262.1 Lhr family ATP dependent helicase [Anseongella ginsenosidimutans]
MSLQLFHKTVAAWFEKAFQIATPVQLQAWRAIGSGESTLIAAPTGSGKTLAAFLSAIDDLVRQGAEGKLEPGIQVIYVSPLKALSNDIERNLQVPLAGIRMELEKAGLPAPPIEVAVRTGDTSAAERAAMLKRPPHILVTTPESLYLLLTSVRGREMLGTAHTLIIDEIHAVVGDKRGAHLSLSVERLEGLLQRKLHRIGLSATQKPIEEVARFLVGTGGGSGRQAAAECRIVDAGHSRKLDLSIEVPGSPLTAVMANEVWSEIYDKLIALINTHQTTLIFVNTRRLAERLSHNLNERLGPGHVLAHHGSMSKEQRFDAEQKLKSGSLKALVATASMELGIDVGSIDLVCQIGSPRSISAFLQRVGRSGHSVHKTPKGILFPLTLDELADGIAILDAVRRGELDKIIMPEKPLDVLAQQIVAEAACREYGEEELFGLFKKAWPYRHLSRQEFDGVLQMLSEGFSGRSGRRGAYLFHDRINGRLSGRKGARLTAMICGGAIPDNFEYDVVLEPENVYLGTLNEDFAIESIPGDIFQLGNNSWKILRIENGRVRVADAAGQPPNIPFWLGEAPGRTNELSSAVSRLREEVAARLERGDAADWLVKEKGIAPEAAEQFADYLALAKAALNTMPSQDTIVMERFFDEAGDMHLVIHSPFGSRMNKAWGLALRKRFCRKFNFELQAAANDNAIILSLGPTHSFPLEEVFSYLHPETVREVLIQAFLDAPLFGVRWRWNASRALAVIRRRGSKKVPAQLQRMQSEDLIAQVFPDQLACLENIAGDREVPDHPLVKQTIHDCLYEAMDIEGLESLLRKIQQKEVQMVAKDLKEPSVLAHEILNARVYAFLDDAPLEERRTLAVKNRRWLSVPEAAETGKLDPAAIEAVRKEAWPEVMNADELHDALLLSGFITSAEGKENDWESYFRELAGAGRVAMLPLDEDYRLWLAAERLPQLRKLYPGKRFEEEPDLPEKLREGISPGKDPLTELIRGRLEIMGPVSSVCLAGLLRLPENNINQALYALENEGFVFRGNFTGGAEQEWCERRLLSRIHRYTIKRLRSEIQPVSAACYMRFLLDWHQVVAGSQPEGPVSLEHAFQKLEGFEAPAIAWESDILPARLPSYDHQWLDMLCMAGKITWGRFRYSPPAVDKKTSSPVRNTPIAFAERGNLNAWRQATAAGGGTGAVLTAGERLSAKGIQVLEILQKRGASFFEDIISQAGLFPSQGEEALGELISAGLVSSDSFTGLRALLVPDKYKTESGRRRKTEVFSMSYAGRWSLLRDPAAAAGDSKTRAETIAWALLRRYGVIFRKLVERENLALPWRELVRVFRTLEARGQIRGGRFVEGFWGEQFALPEAIVLLRKSKKTPLSNTLVAVSAADPLNLTGILFSGRRIPGHAGNRILYADGVPVAFKEAKELHFLTVAEGAGKWEWREALIRRQVPPILRKYLAAPH